MEFRLGALILLLLPLLAGGVNDGFYCDRRLVTVGDPVWEVARKCPEPFWSDTFDRARLYDRHGHPHGFERIEVWVINFGASRFMRRLEFVNGRLERVRSLGYGVDHRPGSRRCGPNELANAGDTLAEVFARCGEPDHSYSVPSGGRHYGRGGRSAERRTWVYDFGHRHRPRELVFIGDRLQNVSMR